MLDVIKTLKTDFRNFLDGSYRAQFADRDPARLDTILGACELAIDSIARCNAAYHNVEHTLYVTAAGQAILAGKQIDSQVSSAEWTNVTIALLFHDIGFVPGLCKLDNNDYFHTGLAEDMIQLERGKTDASLMPYHVDRGQRFVEEQYANQGLDIDLIQQCIERTRFPIPSDPEYRETRDLPGLVRAADLIGQFSDPRYLNKLNALFQEFEEQGLNEKIGYETLQDMLENYPDFYAYSVVPFIQEGQRLLELTEEGKSILKSMEDNLETARNANTY